MFSTEQSRKLYDRACRSLALGVSSGLRRSVTPDPLYFERADGPYFYDVDGHELLDYTLAWGPLILGSNHSELNDAIQKQLHRGYTFGAQHLGEIELAEKICRAVPGVEQVIFSNTGTEAVQAALRLARAKTSRSKIIKFEGHYHGWLNNVLVSYRPKPQDIGRAAAGCGGQPFPEFADTLVLPWNDLAAVEEAFAAHGDQIACVLTEPILINSGSLMPAEGYLAGLIHLCRKYGAVSIFDEVITGFRIALGGAREYFNLSPDLSVYAKAIAGGFSMAAVGGSAEMFDVLRQGKTIHAGTYNGNGIAVAAAIATIDVLARPGTFDRMHAHGQKIRQALERACKAAGLPMVSTGLGSVFSVHLGITKPPMQYTDFARADAALYTRFRALMLERGVQLLPEGRWYVGATHTDAELERVIPAIGESIGLLKQS